MTSPDLHVIVGAGPVGAALARLLAGDGHRVTVLSRSGRDPGIPGVASFAADSSDPEALTRRAEGAAVLYNCANPATYTRWEREWPPLAGSILTTAEHTGAVLVTVSNLYGYGPVDAEITAETPSRAIDHKGRLRERLWQEAREAHRAGRVRATEARASDYLGPSVTPTGSLLARYASATLANRAATVFSDPGQPHTWTAIDDVARTLATLGREERAWGSPWIVPASPPATVRDVLRQLGERVGAGEPRLRVVPRGILRATAPIVPLIRELTGVLYQFDRPFVASGAETAETFDLAPTAWDPLLDVTAAAWHARLTS